MGYENSRASLSLCGGGQGMKILGPPPSAWNSIVDILETGRTILIEGVSSCVGAENDSYIHKHLFLNQNIHRVQDHGGIL